MRNLLGRLNARPSDDLVRIARFWQIPLRGDDRGRHVGTIYRVMTDIRACRDAWDRFDPMSRDIVRALAFTETGPQTIPELAEKLEIPEETVRDGAVRLFRWGLLAREGDRQELPVGATPRLFLPRELGLDFRRVQDEIDAGDQSRSSLRTLLEVRDDPDLEETVELWGIRVIPGLRRRNELVGETMRQVGSANRVESVIKALHQPARTLWNIVRDASSEDGPVPLADAVEQAGLTVPDEDTMKAVAAGGKLRDALIELESAGLVMHTYLRDGSRALFVPQEILHPGMIATAVPLRPLQPLESVDVHEPDPMHPFALAWDVMTVVREIASKGAPVWVPGEPLSRSWQRRLNSRLWFGGEEIPPEGYLGMLLYLALGVDVIEPGPHVPTSGGDKGAIRPQATNRIRQWRSQGFAGQTAALRDVWLVADQWIEGRERELIDVWGAEWQGFRRRLLGGLRDIGEGEWLLVSDVARRIAEQDPGLIGSTFTAASARGGTERGDARISAIAQIVEVELQTAMWWFGFVELTRVEKKGPAMRVTSGARLAAADSRAVLDPDAAHEGERVLTVEPTGLVTLHRPAPLHVWSLTAFGDAESLRPEVTYQLRPGSVGRALGAGFDLKQIVDYLERQAQAPVPDEVMQLLREWTAGYQRVRLRRVALLMPDFDTGIEQLREVAEEAGLEIIDETNPTHGGLMVFLPLTGDDALAAEEVLLSALRGAGYVGQWATGKGS